jgi:uncharacterized protein (TIGR02421 family)
MQSPLRKAIARLDEAAAPIKPLQWLAWPASVRRRFFERDCAELPQVDYPAFDPQPSLDAVQRARLAIGAGDDPVSAWLLRQADAIEASARMLAAASTPAFGRYAATVYGTPTADGAGGATLAHARAIDAIHAANRTALDGGPGSDGYDGDALAAVLERAIAATFAGAGPGVAVVDELAAKVLAGPETIRVRRSARFDATEAERLIAHEVGVHALTSLNGRRQSTLPLLARPLPYASTTQEGLAVLAEWLSGHMGLDRLRRLAERVLAVQRALDGADFIEVYRFFRTRGDDPGQAFDDTRRIFRGGCPRGGSVFTKDIVYLAGLGRVGGFLSEAAAVGRSDLVPLLFAGKLDVADVDALAALTLAGDCRTPRFLPPWAADRTRLLGQLTGSRLFHRVDANQPTFAATLAASPPLDGLA